MEAIAAAASIAGIITLAAQAIDGLQKLHIFFTDVSTASRTVARLLSDINSLIGVLHNIDTVLNQAEAQSRNQNFAQLDIKLEDCAKDVVIWLTTAKALRPGGDKGGRAWMRRAKLAGKGEIISRIREEIGRHRQALCLSLAVFGRTIDLQTSEQIHQMRGRFDDVFTSSLSSHGAHHEALRRIERYSITSMQSSAHSLKSMDSLRTELSRLEAMITSSQASTTSRIEYSEQDFGLDPESKESQPTEAYQGVSGAQPHPNLECVDAILPPQESTARSSSGSRGSSEVRNSKLHNELSTKNPLNVHTDYHTLVREQEDLSKRFSEISSGHESALLYAQFSRSTSPRANARAVEPSSIEIDQQSSQVDNHAQGEDSFAGNLPISLHADRPRESRHITGDLTVPYGTQASQSARSSISYRTNNRSSSIYELPAKDRPQAYIDPMDFTDIYKALQQSLAAAYPPVVAKYIVLQDLALLHENHSNILESRPNIILHGSHYQENQLSKSIQPHLKELRHHLEALQDAVDEAAVKCLEQGYSISELNALCLTSKIHGVAHNQTQTPPELDPGIDGKRSEGDMEQDSSGEDSEAYFSSAE